MTILQTSECKIYHYNQDMLKLKTTTKSDLANIEYLQILAALSAHKTH